MVSPPAAAAPWPRRPRRRRRRARRRRLRPAERIARRRRNLRCAREGEEGARRKEGRAARPAKGCAGAPDLARSMVLAPSLPSRPTCEGGLVPRLDLRRGGRRRRRRARQAPRREARVTFAQRNLPRGASKGPGCPPPAGVLAGFPGRKSREKSPGACASGY